MRFVVVVVFVFICVGVTIVGRAVAVKWFAVIARMVVVVIVRVAGMAVSVVARIVRVIVGV